MTYGVDYPWSKPAPAALRDAGVTFAMRYLSKDPGKNLTLAEANALAAAGIWSGVVWETTAGRALAGRAAGAADAREALRQATACGMPAGRPIYMAVDTDTTWSQVQAYFQGVRDVLPTEQVGVYGGIRIIAGAADSGLVSWYWQAEAWSGGRWEPRAHIRQAGTARIGGVDCDKNTAMTSDFGQWMPGCTPTLAEEDELATTLTQERSDSWNSMIWGLKYTSEAILKLVQAQSATIEAQGATIEKLVTALTAVHGIDEAALVEEIKQAIAAAVVKVDVTVGQKEA